METRKNSEKRWKIWKYLFIILTVFLILNLIMLLIPDQNIEISKEQNVSSFVPGDDKTSVSLKIPAVDSKGKGVSTSLKVEAMQGTGRTLTDIDNLLFWADTQQSIRVAKKVAGNISGVDLNSVDLIYSVEADASVIGGPSAGAALTLATISALENKPLNKSIMITGTVNHDGTIGPVDGILEKAKAAQKTGAETLLVPLLQSRDVVYETREHCEVFGTSEVCTTETVPRKVDLVKETGVKVIEVGSIEKAMEWFF